MEISEIITAVGIHLIVPLLGVAAFLLLCRRMTQAQIPSPPFVTYFILFAAFGGWLIVLLTALLWEWSGMASIGVFGLVLIAPFVTTGLALSLSSQRTLSRFHRGAFAASVAYSGLTLGGLGVWIITR